MFFYFPRREEFSLLPLELKRRPFSAFLSVSRHKQRKITGKTNRVSQWGVEPPRAHRTLIYEGLSLNLSPVCVTNVCVTCCVCVCLLERDSNMLCAIDGSKCAAFVFTSLKKELLPLDSLHPLLPSFSLHHLHPLLIQIHTQQAAWDISQEVLDAKIKRASAKWYKCKFMVYVISVERTLTENTSFSFSISAKTSITHFQSAAEMRTSGAWNTLRH